MSYRGQCGTWLSLTWAEFESTLKGEGRGGIKLNIGKMYVGGGLRSVSKRR